MLAGVGRGDGWHDRVQVCLEVVGSEGGVQVRDIALQIGVDILFFLEHSKH